MSWAGEFGVFLPQGWRPDLPEDSVDSAADFQTMLDVAREAEAAAYSAVWLFDHLDPDPPSATRRSFECWLSLSAAAAVTSRVRLGPMVTCCAYRSAALLSRMCTTLDAASGGRLVLGLGAGWQRSELAVYASRVSSFSQRLSEMSRTIDVVRAIWTGAPPLVGHGLQPGTGSLPMRRQPAIWVGGNGDRTLQASARLADGVIMIGPPDFVGGRLDLLSRCCDEVGRDPASITKAVLWRPMLAGNPAEERTIGHRIAARLGTSYQQLKEDTFRHCLGTAEQMAERIMEYRQLGFDHQALYMPHAAEADTVLRFAREVGPLVGWDC